jgi:putative ABC transport system ATP-binding protein
MTPIIAAQGVSKVYRTGSGVDFTALREVDVSIEPGEFVAITGHSGSGKTTFMNIVGCLDRPTGGRYLLLGEDVGTAPAQALSAVRNRHIGFVFQNFNLLPRYSALDNVGLARLYAGDSRSEARERALEALKLVGLESHAQHRPTELSGGQQQRVAIARALVNSPKLLLADEPTGNLDTATSDDVMRLLKDLNTKLGATVVLVTHEPDIAAQAQRQIRFKDGRVVGDSANDAKVRR